MARAKNVKWKVDVAERAGEAAHELAIKYRAAIERRLAAGLIDGLRSDLDELRGGRAGARSAHSDQYASTATQNEAAAHGAKLVSAIREAVRDGSHDPALHKLFGVGKRVDPKKVSSVEAGLQTILDAAQKDPDGARSVGLLPADLTEVEADLKALGTADKTQEGKKVTSQGATADRNSTQARVEKAVDSIIAAGVLEFRNQPLIAQLFTRVTPGKGESGASDKDEQADKEKKAAEEKAKLEKTEKPKEPPQKA